HALPSPHTVLSGVCVTLPVAGSQASVVHATLSVVTIGVPAWQPAVASQVSTPLHALPSPHAVLSGVCVTLPVAGSQASVVHATLSVVTIGVPAWQPAVASQVSTPLHALPSPHAVLSGVCVTFPVAGSQASVVHATLSVVTIGVPAWQPAVASQVSTPLRALPSPHAVLSGVCVTFPVAGSQASVVHATLSVVTIGVPAWQPAVASQ